MTPKQKNRLFVVLAILIGVSIATVLGLTAFKENIRFFVELKDVKDINTDQNSQYRIAGLVKPGSIEKQADNISFKFTLTDCVADVNVFYTGQLPDLFREGQTIVANGRFDADRTMQAGEVLAKHDENYVPTEAAASLIEEQKNICINNNSNSNTGNSAPAPVSY